MCGGGAFEQFDHFSKQTAYKLICLGLVCGTINNEYQCVPMNEYHHHEMVVYVDLEENDIKVLSGLHAAH